MDFSSYTFTVVTCIAPNHIHKPKEDLLTMHEEKASYMAQAPHASSDLPTETYRLGTDV